MESIGRFASRRECAASVEELEMVQEVGVGHWERVGVPGWWGPVHARIGGGPGMRVCTGQRARACTPWRRICGSAMVRVVNCKVGKQVVDPYCRWDTVFLILVAPEDAGEPGGKFWSWVALVQKLYKVSVQVSKEDFIMAAGSIESQPLRGKHFGK